MEFVPLVATLALALKLLDTVKYGLARDWNALSTQVASWVSGCVSIFLLAATDFAGGVMIGDSALADMNVASLLLVGLSVASSGSVLYDFKKAVDVTDSAKTPSLLASARDATPR